MSVYALATVTEISTAPQPVVTIITAGALSVRPDAVDGFESTRTPGNLVHPILGRPYPNVTLRPASARSGQLRLAFAGESASADAETLLSEPQVFELVPGALESARFSFVVTGQITRRLNAEGYWSVEFGYSEVKP